MATWLSDTNEGMGKCSRCSRGMGNETISEIAPCGEIALLIRWRANGRRAAN